jgi:lysophospholipase L1-like esterase
MTIGVWGDSITYGLRDSEALGWAGRLRKSLLTDGNHRLYNFGICGETSEDILKRFAIEAAAIEPEYIIFAIGINDAKYPTDDAVNKVPLPQYIANMEQLISQAKHYTNSITLISATKADDAWRSARGSKYLNDETKKYNAAMQDIAQQHGIQFIDVFNTLDPSTDLAEGLHPNASGYQKMFEAIKQQLPSFAE